MIAEATYQVSQVKIHYGRPNDVTGVEEVAASQLFRELEARGVQRRLFSYEDGTSQTVNGEFTQWKLIQSNAVAETWDVRNSTQENLTAFADIMADAVKSGRVPTGEALVPLHHAALELNRRHGHASLQTEIDRPNAEDILIGFNDLQSRDTGDTDIDWPRVYVDVTRAIGCVLDLGDYDTWRSLTLDGHTRVALVTTLHRWAMIEHIRRGVAKRQAAPQPFFPVGAVAPF